MRYKYTPEKIDYFEVFKDDLPEIVDLKLAELKPLVKERSAILLMADERLRSIRHWFNKEMWKIWVYEPAKIALDSAYKELKRCYWLDKRLKAVGMPTYSSKMTIEEFKAAYPLYETIEQYAAINNRGFAICPFHSERTASLKVYNDHYYCFSCQQGGDVISFLMKIHNITFNELLNGTSKF